MFMRVIVLFTFFVSSVLGFSEWMTSGQLCKRSIKVGEVIMNEEIIESNQRSLIVTRNDVELQTGDIYIPGETLQVKISDPSYQYVYEVSKNAKFEKGGCGGTRVANKKIVNLIVPTSELEYKNIDIVAAWALGRSQVKITKTFTLVPPSEPPTARELKDENTPETQETNEEVRKSQNLEVPKVPSLNQSDTTEGRPVRSKKAALLTGGTLRRRIDQTNNQPENSETISETNQTAKRKRRSLFNEERRKNKQRYPVVAIEDNEEISELVRTKLKEQSALAFQFNLGLVLFGFVVFLISCAGIVNLFWPMRFRIIRFIKRSFGLRVVDE